MYVYDSFWLKSTQNMDELRERRLRSPCGEKVAACRAFHRPSARGGSAVALAEDEENSLVGGPEGLG